MNKNDSLRSFVKKRETVKYGGAAIIISITLVTFAWLESATVVNQSFDFLKIIKTILTVLLISIDIFILFTMFNAKRTVFFQGLLWASPTLTGLIMFITSIHIVAPIMGTSVWIMIVLELFSLGTIGLVQYTIFKSRIQSSEKVFNELYHPGENSGIWKESMYKSINSPDLTPAKLKKYQLFSRIVSPIAPALGFMISRSLSGKVETIVTCLLYFLSAWVCVYLSIRYAAVAVQLCEWEKKINKPIFYIKR